MLKKFIENIEVIDISSKGKGVCKDKSGRVIFLMESFRRPHKHKNYMEKKKLF